MTFDLRSDTMTRPSAAMRAAMASAEVGDDVVGEDPTVNRLEEHAARLFGKEAALFVPSGTMANEVCIGTLTRPGDEIVAEREAHVFLNEVGGVARLWGCQVVQVPGHRGLMDPDDVERAIRVSDIHHPRTTLLSIEDTHNFGGGTVLPLDRLDALVAVARRHELAVHVDGARIFNAQVASGVPVSRIARDVDLVTTCLSKGLGAPVGSLVMGSREHVESCRRLRKLLGGGMRQAGILAAAGLIALDEGPQLMAADHARAKALGETLAELAGVDLEPADVETNIVMARIKPRAASVRARGLDAPAAEAALRERGILVYALDSVRLRFVFHRDAGDDALDAAIAACRAVLA